MKRYKYTCKNQEQHDLLAGICFNLGHYVRYANWKITAAPVFATASDGSFLFVAADSEVAAGCVEVADLAEMIKVIVGVKEIRHHPAQPQDFWTVGAYTIGWEREEPFAGTCCIKASKNVLVCIQPETIKEVYDRGRQLGFIKQEIKEQQK